MAEKILKSRLQLKYDSYENWMSSTLVLKAGEAAVAYIQTGDTQLVNGVSAPQTLVKIGDGTHTFKDLPYLSALSADTYAWAKAATKPEYTASEIKNLSEFISGEIQDSNTQYSIVKVTDYQYKLVSKEIGEETFTNEVGVINIPKYDDTTVKADIAANTSAIEALQALVGSTAVATQITNAINALDLANTYAAKVHGHVIADVEGLSDAIADAKKAGTDANTALEAYKTSNDEALAAEKSRAEAAEKANADAIAAINNETTGILAQAKEHANGLDSAMNTRVEALEAAVGEGGSVADKITAEIEKLDADVTSAAVETGKGIQVQVVETDGKITNVNVTGSFDSKYDALGAADTVNTALETYKGTNDAAVKKVADDLAEEKTRAEGIEGGLNTRLAAVEADYLKGEDKTELQGQITTNKNAIDVLNGTGVGSVSKTVSDAIAAIVADAPESLNTLKEISDWISGHADDAAAMNSAIGDNADAIASLETLVGTLPEGATSTTVVGYIGEAIEGLKIGDYAKAADLTAAVNRIVTLEGKAHTHDNKDLLDTYTQTEANLADAVAKKHEHANKTVLDGITAEQVAAWDAAEGNALAAVDALAKGAVATNTKAIADEKTRAEGIEAGLRTDVDSKAAQSDLEALEGRVTTAEGTLATKADQTALESLAGRVTTVEGVAGSAVQSVTAAADSGLKATREGNAVAIAIDDTLTFVFDCGNATA